MKTESTQPKEYRIIVKGRLSQSWAEDWGLSCEYDGNTTVLNGSFADQPALHGLLNHIRDLNVTLISAECINYF